MKIDFKKHILFVCVFFITITTKVYAVNQNATVNDNVNRYIASDDATFKFSSWHYWEGTTGYWKFKRSDNGEYNKIYDKRIKDWFPGTSKRLPGGKISQKFKLPNQVKKFIKIYGSDKLGIKFNVGNDRSVLGKSISYRIDGDYIIIEFFGILNYVRNDMWQALNPRVANAMSREVYTPQVADGCGQNRISVGGGGTGQGSGSIKINEDMVRHAYKSGDWLHIGGNLSSWGTFKNGGNNGVIFEFPIEIKYYDLDVETYTPTQSGFYKGNNGNWVKVGNDFHISQKGATSNNDNNIRVNFNRLQLDTKSESIKIDSNINVNNNESWNYDINPNSYIDVVGNHSRRDNRFVISDYTLRAKREGEFRIRGWSNLGNNNGTYKESSWSGDIYLKSDGTAPYADTEINYNSDRDKFNIDVKNVSDGNGSGVKKVWVEITDRRDTSKKKVIELSKDYRGIYSYENNVINIFDKGKAGEIKIQVFAEDNVGNSRKVGEKDIDLLKLKASVYRDLEPHDPIFLTKELGTVKVNLTGYFDRLEIIFPNELSNLSIDTKLNPVLEDVYNYKFKIPDNATNKEYKLHIIGHKGNQIKEDFPSIKVDGNITKILKTRIRFQGDVNMK